MVVIKLDQKIRRIGTVYPCRTVFDLIIFTFSCYCITKNHSSNGLSAKKSDIEFFHRAYPVGSSLFVNLKAELVKNVSRILKSQMSVNIPVKILCL